MSRTCNPIFNRISRLTLSACTMALAVGLAACANNTSNIKTGSVPSRGKPIAEMKIDELLRLRQTPPPAGKPRWTTRMLAKHTGLSQSTVVRIARSHRYRTAPTVSTTTDKQPEVRPSQPTARAVHTA